MPIWGPFAMIAAGVAAIWVELFVPSFGIISLAGVGIIATAVVMAFRTLPYPWGVVVLVTAMVVPPAVLLTLLKRFSRSPWGRRMILTTTLAEEEEPIPVGARGQSLTALHPGGYAMVNDRKVSAVTRGEFIAPDCPVVVVSRRGADIVVREESTNDAI